MKSRRSLIAILLCLCTVFSAAAMVTLSAHAATSVTYAQINASAKTIADTVESKNALPAKVTCGSTTITHAQFMYLASKVVIALNKGSKSGSITVPTMATAPSPNGSVKAYNMYKSEYAKRAREIITFMDKNKKAPNYVTCNGGKLKYQDSVFALAKILRYYKANSALPNYCYVANRTWKADVNILSNNKAAITSQPKALTVTAGAKATFKVTATNAKSYQWQRSTDGGKTWTNITTSGGTTATLRFTATTSHNGRLYRCNVRGASNSVTTTAVKLTVKAAATGWLENTSSYSSFLKATSHAQSKNATLVSVAKTGIKYSGGAPKTMYQAAKQLMKYLNVKTSWANYSNTRQGALKTWNKKTGNCCDLAHLAAACGRAVGIPARYRHGHCQFSGHATGHVWAEYWCGKAYSWKAIDLCNNSHTVGSTYKTYYYMSYDKQADIGF